MNAALLVLLLVFQGTPATTSKGAVQGVVVNAATGAPVAGAQVRLWRELVPGERNRSNQIVEATTPLISRLLLLPEVFPSDAGGRYSATNLDEGVYRLVVVNARGFSRQEYGQPAQNMRANPQTHGTLGRSFRVSRGTTVTGIDVRLNLTAVVSGRVTDPDGKPVIGLSVQLQPIEYDGQGRRVLYPGDLNTRTDDRGEYRIADVPAGRFYVAAGIPGIDQNRTRFLELKQKRYVWTFYPSSPHEQGAAIVNVKPGEERQRIDIAVIRQQNFYAIRGRVIDATTGRVPTGTIALSASHLLADGDRGTGGPTSPNTAMNSTQATYNPADGSFELQGMEPGWYGFVIYAGRNQSITGNVVNVDGADLHDVVLAVSGSVIEGRISSDNASMSTSAFSGARIRLIRAVVFGPDVIPVQPGPDGRFRINDMKLGEYRLTVSDLPAGTYVKDIRIDGTSVVNSTWVFTVLTHALLGDRLLGRQGQEGGGFDVTRTVFHR